MAKEIYNKTQLTPQTQFERHVYHRDMFAHYLRWTHVMRYVESIRASEKRYDVKLLDFGCGSGEMLEVFYRNRCMLGQYLGLDIRKQTIDKNNEKFKVCNFAEFRQADLCQDELDLGQTFDVITCFEVFEHIGHANADAFLDNIAYHCHKDTIIFFSTPNYDPSVGAAKNHMLGDGPDKEIGEWDHFELQDKLSEYFDIEAKYGTFASIKDYKNDLNDWQQKMYDTLHEYYSKDLLSCLMAPMFPEKSRNCLWVLKVKED